MILVSATDDECREAGGSQYVVIHDGWYLGSTPVVQVPSQVSTKVRQQVSEAKFLSLLR